MAWANDRGGSGTATGTTAWSAAIPLFDGPNRITLTARDTAGNASQTEVLVTYLPPDTTAPTVGITFPTDAQEAATGDPLANLSGEADDDRAVMRVTWTNSRGGSGEATGGRVWFANGIVLQPGVNLLTVTAYDEADNARSDTLSVTYTLPLTVTPGAGVNGGISPNAPRTVNHGGSVFFTGTPSPGWQVGTWLVNGVAVQSGGTIFTLGDVTADATVQVTFTPAPVTPFTATRIFLEPVTAPGTGTQARMIFTGLAGRVYRVEFADSLATDSVGWQLLGTATADALGEFQFVDPPPLPLRRFYRAVLPVTAPAIGMQRASAPGSAMSSRLAFPGIAGRTYRVECTDDLAASPIQWQTLGTATADGAGEVQFVDQAPLPLRRFYRAVEQ